MQKKTIALFTTVYPEGKQFLCDFFSSLSAQTDNDFDLWIGLDRIRETKLNEYICDDYQAICIEQKNNESNISLRQRAMKEMVELYPGVIFVDSDDILAPSRISAARSSLKHYDMYGCAMKIIDVNGADLHVSFQMPSGTDITSLLPRFNIFGMSNTCYSTDLLKKCLPFPTDCILLDWFVATRAWAQNVRMCFDSVQQMYYRQYSSNTARVLPPFTQEQIIKSTELVLQHYNNVLNNIPELPNTKRILIENAQNYVEAFNYSIKQSPEKLQRYIIGLNNLPPNHIWWSCIAHPELEGLWKN